MMLSQTERIGQYVDTGVGILKGDVQFIRINGQESRAHLYPCKHTDYLGLVKYQWFQFQPLLVATLLFAAEIIRAYSLKS